MGGNTTLLDTTEISGQKKGQPFKKKRHRGIKNLQDYKGKIELDGKKVIVLECKQCGQRYLVPLRCNLRTCPYCASDRARKVYQEVSNTIRQIKREKGYTLKLITFGYGTEGNIRSAIKKSKKAFKKIWHNLLEMEGSGAVITFELGEKNNSVHIHCLYYGGFIRRKDLIKEWKRLTGKWYVDIRMARGKQAIKEVIKYIGKALLDLSHKEGYKIEMALRGLRRLVTYGIFYKRITGNKNICPICHSSSWKFIIISKFNHELVNQLLIQRQFWKD
ncbi:protein rep [Patescibacteria group bacterium]|nr:protein rep [Patescibacteria group bacterium]